MMYFLRPKKRPTIIVDSCLAIQTRHLLDNLFMRAFHEWASLLIFYPFTFYFRRLSIYYSKINIIRTRNQPHATQEHIAHRSGNFGANTRQEKPLGFYLIFIFIFIFI
jgi:hypothetical protein